MEVWIFHFPLMEGVACAWTRPAAAARTSNTSEDFIVFPSKLRLRRKTSQKDDNVTLSAMSTLLCHLALWCHIVAFSIHHGNRPKHFAGRAAGPNEPPGAQAGICAKRDLGCRNRPFLQEGI